MSVWIYLDYTVDKMGDDLGLSHTVFERNITHNLVPMLKKSGTYPAIYYSQGTHAGEWIDKLSRGVNAMQLFPDEFRALNPINGWGSYDSALRFLTEFLEACTKYPHAQIRVSK